MAGCRSLLGKLLVEDAAGIELLDHRSVLVDAEVTGDGEVALVENVLDSDLSLVVGHEVLKGDSCLEADERSRQVEEDDTLGAIIEDTSLVGSLVEAVPGTTGRVDLVRLELPLVLKVLAVLAEVPGDLRNIFLAPLKPILYTGLDIEDGQRSNSAGPYRPPDAGHIATVDGSEDEVSS